MPIAAWEFNGDLKDSIGFATGSQRVLAKHPTVVGPSSLRISYLRSKGLPFELKAKTLEVFCTIQNLDMKGGGLKGNRVQ